MNGAPRISAADTAMAVHNQPYAGPRACIAAIVVGMTQSRKSADFADYADLQTFREKRTAAPSAAVTASGGAMRLVCADRRGNRARKHRRDCRRFDEHPGVALFQEL